MLFSPGSTCLGGTCSRLRSTLNHFNVHSCITLIFFLKRRCSRPLCGRHFFSSAYVWQKSGQKCNSHRNYWSIIIAPESCSDFWHFVFHPRNFHFFFGVTSGKESRVLDRWSATRSIHSPEKPVLSRNPEPFIVMDPYSILHGLLQYIVHDMTMWLAGAIGNSA